ncbi:MAG: XRE family transcriptional regulator [Candidatus Omnitrophota bacterium]|jgi:transcriptional regulator with XRE-family HTH domain
MYAEFRREYADHFKDQRRQKTARWDLALRALLAEKSDVPGSPLSVGWLSKRTGLSVPYLSNVLSGKIKDPPSARLIKIADGIGISYPEFALRAMGEFEGTFFKTGFAQRGFIDYSQHGFTIQSLSPPGTSQRDFFLGILTIKPLRELKRWKFQTNSMIAVYVQQGTLEIMYGEKKHRLHANESAYFDGAIPHRFKNVDTFEARVFLATRPPIH